MTSSRRKGKRGELEFAALLRDLLETPSVAQAGEAKPALFYRVDRERWGAVIALADVVPGFEAEARELNMTWEDEHRIKLCAVTRLLVSVACGVVPRLDRGERNT